MVPEVKKCTVKQCFYNRGEECHAHAITVGSDQPICETFANGSSNTDRQGAGEVGACHVTKCTFNNNMYCHACDDIQVDMTSGKAMCTTYRPR
mgnify:CR=1 FL=1